MEFAPGYHVQHWTRDGTELWRRYSGIRAAKRAFRAAVASGEFSNVLLLERITTNWLAESEPEPALRLIEDWPCAEESRQRIDRPQPRRATRLPDPAARAPTGSRRETASSKATLRKMRQRELFA